MTSKISQVLKDTKIHQIHGHFIDFDLNGELLGKCALGILACESPDETLHLSKYNRGGLWDNFDRLFKSYGVEDIKGLPQPSIYNGWSFSTTSTLTDIIMHLNDTKELTFKQIGEFLEVTFDL